jgi:hypothetical protein
MQRRSIGIVAITCGLLANAASAWAAAETWVSGTGSNAGACPIAAPCRTFSYAHGQTSAGGTINVLSAGDFGPLTITKSISIVADGVQAGILGGGSIGAAIKIQAGVGGIVTLRGLTIDLRGTDNDGISFLSGTVLHVHDCFIRGSTHGIRFTPTTTSELYVADSVIADSSTKGAGGVWVAPTGSSIVKVVLDRVRVENSGTAGISFFLGGDTVASISAIVRDSVAAGSSKLAAGNGGPGIVASGYGSGTAKVMVDRSAFAHNGAGVLVIGARATILIGDSTLTGNHTGLSILSGGVIESYGTNKVSGNVNDGTPTSTIAMK